MNTQEAKTTIERQILLKRTADKGWPIEDFAIKSLEACLADINQGKNLEVPAMRCVNCGLILSQPLMETEGCPNCHGLDIDDKVNI